MEAGKKGLRGLINKPRSTSPVADPKTSPRVDDPDTKHIFLNKKALASQKDYKVHLGTAAKDLRSYRVPSEVANGLEVKYAGTPCETREWHEEAAERARSAAKNCKR